MRGQFDCLGISTPDRRAAVMPLIRAFKPARAEELRETAERLWAMREREYQYVAADLLVRCQDALSLDDLAWLLELAQKKSWWDTVDCIVKVVGKIVRRSGVKGVRAMDRGIRDTNFWVRRIAMLHQLGWRGDTDTERLFRYAEFLAPEKEFFVRKAIGWALRQYAWTDGADIKKYVRLNRARLSNLSCREALKNIGRAR